MAEIGRPTVMTEETVKKLEEAFLMGFTDREACLYANISHQALYDYCKLNPEYTDRKEMLKEQPKIQAKMNINYELKQGDKDTSKWYLERKAKDEFSLKQEIDQNIGNKDDKPFNFTNLTTEQIRELLKDEDKE